MKKYRYVLLVLVLGIALMMLPGKQEGPEIPDPTEPQQTDMETRLEEILRRIAGAGEVAVMLTESAGETVIYQTNDDGADTVLVEDAQRNEQGLVRSREPPAYRGAIIVCEGADQMEVRLAVVEAVCNVTGLSSNRITVLKME